MEQSRIASSKTERLDCSEMAASCSGREDRVSLVWRDVGRMFLSVSDCTGSGAITYIAKSRAMRMSIGGLKPPYRRRLAPARGIPRNRNLP